MKDSLLNSNPWLREPARRAALLRVSAASSSAVEGIVKPFQSKPSGTVKPTPRAPRAKPEPTRG